MRFFKNQIFPLIMLSMTVSLLFIGCRNRQRSGTEIELPAEGLISITELGQMGQSTETEAVVQSVQLATPEWSTTELDCMVKGGTESADGWVNLVPSQDPWFMNYIEGDSQGRVWVATDGNGIFMFESGEWTEYSPETRPDMRGDSIRGFAVGENKVYAGEYASTAGGGVMIYDIASDSWTNSWPGESELTGGGVGGIAVANDGTAYLSAAAFTTNVTSNGNETIIQQQPAALNIVEDGVWRNVNMPFSASFSDGLIDIAGNYWVATGTETWRYDGANWKTFPGIIAQYIATDSFGNIWAAGKSGLAVYNGEWHLFDRDSFPLGEHWLTAVAVDAQDRVWFVTAESITIYNGSEWIIFTDEQLGVEYGFDNVIGFDASGCAWIGTDFEGLFVFNHQLDFGSGDYSFLDSVDDE